jgi:hypothetical protein
MTIHWKALEDHFLIIVLIISFMIEIFFKYAFSEMFSKYQQYLKSAV